MKKTLRRKMRSVLRSLSADDRHRKAGDACRLLLESEPWQRARSVFVYLSMEHEIDTTPLIEAGWRDGKRVLAPRVVPGQPRMNAVEISGWTDCIPGFRGILEPIHGEPAQVSELDLIVVPALAFDLRGYRLGQGGGYYDRFLADPGVRASRCGVAFEEQVVDQLVVEPHDQPVHLLVTDARVRTITPGAT